MVCEEPDVGPGLVGVHRRPQHPQRLLQVAGLAEEPPAEPDPYQGAQRPGWGDGGAVCAWTGAGRQRGERPPGAERGRVLVDGDNTLPVLSTGGDRLVEYVGQLLLLGGVDQQRAGREPVLLDVADAVVAPPSRVTVRRSSASAGSGCSGSCLAPISPLSAPAAAARSCPVPVRRGGRATLREPTSIRYLRLA